MCNILLSSFLRNSVPNFSMLHSKNIIPFIKYSINNCIVIINNILNKEKNYLFTWDNLCQPIMDVENDLNKIWSSIELLNSVKNNYNLRIVYQKSLLLISEYQTWLIQNNTLYSAYKNLRENKHYTSLTQIQKTSLENILQDFKLSGITLSYQDKELYSSIIKKINYLYCTYNNNILDSTKHWNKIINDEKELSGLQKDFLKKISTHDPNNPTIKQWKLTLDYPTFNTIITYCDNRKIRQEIFKAYITRASSITKNNTPTKWDNEPLIHEIIYLRQKLARLLDFNNYADKSIFTKMADNTDVVFNFLNNLIELITPYAKKEFSDIRKFAQKNHNILSLKPWDISYISEKMKNKQFSISESILKQYFPSTYVIQGLFNIVRKLYNVTITEVKNNENISTWNKHVQFFHIFNNINKQLLGSFYLDIYTRKNKQSGAWMHVGQNKFRKLNGVIQKPIVYIICNFSNPIKNHQFSLLTHNDIITLFHEFGHALHHILTVIDIPNISGINGVEWDAVELPSQLMENYCWSEDTLLMISKHYKTHESIPKYLLNQLIKSKSFNIGLFFLKQLEFSYFDLYIHSKYDINNKESILNIFQKIQKKISVTPNISYNKFPNTFSHIFSGGYAAGYYSYLWSNILAIDIWSKFKNIGILNTEVTMDFKKKILSLGGSQKFINLFINFMGRNPDITTMLQHYGFIK